MAAMSRFYQLDSPGVSHPFFSSSRPLVFAHRGAGALAPENTIAAFDNGLALGADGLELDVHLSRDGVVVVHHDARLGRTTNLPGAVADWTADELARADAGYFFRPLRDVGLETFPFRGQGIGVPTLEVVLARYPEVPIVVELKVNETAFARAVVEVVRRGDAVDRVCLGGFGRRVLREARRVE